MMMPRPRMPRKSGFARKRKGPPLLSFQPPAIGQSCPQHCPPSDAPAEPLGLALSIRDAARIIGCSPWTVRQTLIPRGLPFFRSGASGKMIFYRNQIVRWIETHQGGNP
jgi:hypothetical protein